MSKEKKYDVFISYRRDGGFETAKLIHEQLLKRGYRVFLDVEALRSGPFNTQLFDFIDGASDFLLIVSKNAFDRCYQEGDWVKEEILHAIAVKKNIVPVILKGASFPKSMPNGLEGLDMYNGVNSSHEYFDATIDNLCKKLQAKPHRKISWKNLFIPFLLIVFIIIAFFILKNHFRNVSSAEDARQRERLARIQIEQQKLKQQEEERLARIQIEQQKLKQQEEERLARIQIEQQKLQLERQRRQSSHSPIHAHAASSVAINSAALAKLIKSGNINIFKRMLDDGVDPNTIIEDQGVSLLTYALDNHQKDIASLLLDKGAKADGVNADQVPDARIAMSNEYPDIFEKIISVNKNISANVILNAAANQNSVYLQTLVRHGVNIDVTDRNGDGIVFYALLSGAPENINIAVKACADINRKNHKKQPAAIAFMIYNSRRNNKSKDVLLHFFKTALAYDIFAKDAENNTLLHFANDREIIEYLIKERKLDPNAANSDGDTPLHSATSAYSKHESTFGGLMENYFEATTKQLMICGADKNIKNKNNKRPVDILIERGNFGCAKLFGNNLEVWQSFARSKSIWKYSDLSLTDDFFCEQALSLFCSDKRLDNVFCTGKMYDEAAVFLLALLKKYKYPIRWSEIKLSETFLDEIVQTRETTVVGELMKSGILTSHPNFWRKIVNRALDRSTEQHCDWILQGVDCGGNPNISTSYPYRSLLDFALKKKKLALFEKLLQKGADPELIDKKILNREPDFLKIFLNYSKMPAKKTPAKNMSKKDEDRRLNGSIRIHLEGVKMNLESAERMRQNFLAKNLDVPEMREEVVRLRAERNRLEAILKLPFEEKRRAFEEYKASKRKSSVK